MKKWTSFLLMATMLPLSAFAQNFSGGTGTESDPYKISNPDDLKALSAGVADNEGYAGKYFMLNNDIDLNGVELVPIGSSSTPFNGIFHGQKHSILNLSQNFTSTTYGTGLFGVIGKDAVVTDLVMSGNNQITTDDSVNYTAILVGQNKGTVQNCTVSGSVDGYRYTGGIVGTNSGSILNCSFSGTVKGNWFVGGITGYLDMNGSVTNCVNEGTIQAVKHIGGIVGQANGSTSSPTVISLCTNLGSVLMTGGEMDGYETMAAAGGIVGFSYANNVELCFNAGQVASDNFNPYVGGIAGNNMDGKIANCYNTMNVQGVNGAYVGGIAGINKGSNSVIENCYNTAKVFSDLFKGEICPNEENAGTVSNCYFDKQTADVNTATGTALLTRELASATPPDGFDTEKWVFADGLYPRILGLESIDAALLMAAPVICYASEDGSSYDKPDFITTDFTLGVAEGITWTSDNEAVKITGNQAAISRNPQGDIPVTLTCDVNGRKKAIPIVLVADIKGDGTEANPFLVENANQMRYIATRVSSGYSYADQYIKLMNNIDLGGEDNPFQPAGKSSAYFDGYFDGNGKTISGLYINDPENMYIGLFSKLSDKATVTNLTIGPDSYICGWGYVGAIAGKSCGAITNCNNHARVSGISNVGGITGATDYGATALSGCLNTGAISAEKGQAGGIVGNAIYLKQIERCLNSGSVTITNPEETTGQAGGIAGYSSVAITLCGNTGIIHDMTATEDKAMAGGIVGRTYGSASAPATITQCYNSGTVITATQTNCGPIAGIQQDKADITADCYYDTQAMPGLEPAEGLTGLPTASIVDAANLSGLNAEEWSFGPDRYPIPAHMAENAGAQLAAAALFLADNDDYTRVTGNFELTATDGLEWWTGSSLTLNIDGTTVTVNRQSEDKQCELTAELNGIEKTFRIVVAKEDGSGIAAKAAARPTVTAIDRTIEINGAENAVIAIFDASGRNIRTISRAAACERVNIGQSGVFIVRILDGKDAEAVKVIL